MDDHERFLDAQKFVKTNLRHRLAVLEYCAENNVTMLDIVTATILKVKNSEEHEDVISDLLVDTAATIGSFINDVIMSEAAVEAFCACVRTSSRRKPPKGVPLQ